MSHAPSHCGNCEAPLTGPYCSQCGQSAHESARTMHALLHDGWHSMTHLDGRLWRTLWLLLSKPGEVSRQFIANRRASFIPPFRLYLVVSLVFFGLIGISHHDDVLSIRANDPQNLQGCDQMDAVPSWLAEHARLACQKIIADRGDSLRSVFIASMPRAMFFFLPLLAAVMLLLYWRPRRLYVEHLVFFLHNHSAVFVVGAFEMLVQLAAGAWPVLEPLSGFTGLLFFGWLAAYIYLAMRRFYGQSRARTLAKLLVIGTFYGLALAFTMVLTVLYSVMRL